MFGKGIMEANLISTSDTFLRLVWPHRTTLFAYTYSIALDFARLLSRICSVVNTPPQTLQRQPGNAACAITDTDC